ncbi:MAG: hypothetical protein H9535_13820 [Ignavibacteria bacterium]|nr:hypothetical protein [Ignavibacteria bacterium]
MRSPFVLVLGICFFFGAPHGAALAQASKPDVKPTGGAVPQYTVPTPTKADSNTALFRFVPFVVQEEDKFQSYIQNDALSVWVNVPSLQKNGDTLTALVKRVVRYDIAHTLNKDLVYVDVIKFNTRNDTFARVASLDNKTGSLAMNAKPEWEKTSLDLDITALYHFIGFLHTEKQKK